MNASPSINVHCAAVEAACRLRWPSLRLRLCSTVSVARETARRVRSSCLQVCPCSGASAALEVACLVRWSSSRSCVCSGVSVAREAVIRLEADVLLPNEVLRFGGILQYFCRKKKSKGMLFKRYFLLTLKSALGVTIANALVLCCFCDVPVECDSLTCFSQFVFTERLCRFYQDRGTVK